MGKKKKKDTQTNYLIVETSCDPNIHIMPYTCNLSSKINLSLTQVDFYPCHDMHIICAISILQ